MGEVYRARDTRLDRTVAVKILPAHLTDNDEARQRFDREARSISSLNHPNICHLYDVGQQDGISYLVMEYLQGETLADRLRKRPLSVEEVLQYGIEICEGLDKAHRSGIIHRDLKPSNIMLTKSAVKLMDFGLAKHAATAAAPASAVTVEASALTGRRTIIGTVGYMSPEQVQGTNIDMRSDIFAFGAVLYEMITGRRAFDGSSDISVLSAILEKRPQSIAELQPAAPPELDQIVQTCLAKDPDDRWQSVRDLLWILRSVGRATTTKILPGRRRSRMVLVGVALLAAVVGASSIFVLRRTHETQPPARLQISGPGLFFIENYQAASPDGRYIAFSAFGSETDAAPQPPMVWLRPLNAANMAPLKQTEGAGHLFWSPDSRNIAYFADGKLKKVAIEGGGTPQTICEAPGLARGTWGSNGTILYSEWQSSHAGLFRVNASGGAPTPVKLMNENGTPVLDIDWPYFLPDGEHFLFYSGSTVYAGSMRTLKGKRLSNAESRAEYSSGYVLYIRDGNLVAQRFDQSKLQLNGDPVPLASGVHHRATTGYAEFTVSASLLSYLAGGNRKGLAVRDRSGAVLRQIATADFGATAVSRDGHRLAAEVWDTANNKPDLWIYDLDRNTGSRFASEQGGVYAPIWSPDGKQLIYSSQMDGKGPPHLYRQALDGSPPELMLPAGGQMQRATDWSPQGTEILFTQDRPGCFACAFLGDTWVCHCATGARSLCFTPRSLLAVRNFLPTGNGLHSSR
jgi:Tol biopolymer transport system component